MATAKKEDADKLSGKTVRIMIHPSQDKFAVNPVPISINGVQYTIKRGEEVDIPVELIEVLNNARETQYEQVSNPDQSVRLVPREVLSYPFQVM